MDIRYLAISAMIVDQLAISCLVNMLGESLTIIFFLIFFYITRLCYLLLETRRTRSTFAGYWSRDERSRNYESELKSVRTMIVAGSGGHTAEMVKLVGELSNSYNPRHYVVAVTDRMSQQKIVRLEESKTFPSTDYVIKFIPRSREVGQSWLSTVLTTLHACVHSLFLLLTSRPHLLLCNGPGTCLPLCLAAFASTVIGFHRVRIVFVESICRVNTLSLTGRILYYLADQLIVQWPELQQTYPLTTYLGRVV